MLLLDLGIPCVFLTLTATESSKKPSGSFQSDGKKPAQDDKGIRSDPEQRCGAWKRL